MKGRFLSLIHFLNTKILQEFLIYLFPEFRYNKILFKATSEIDQKVNPLRLKRKKNRLYFKTPQEKALLDLGYTSPEKNTKYLSFHKNRI